MTNNNWPQHLGPTCCESAQCRRIQPVSRFWSAYMGTGFKVIPNPEQVMDCHAYKDALGHLLSASRRTGEEKTACGPPDFFGPSPTYGGS